MSRIQSFSMLLCGAGLFGSILSAQTVISARSGLIHLAEGQVYLKDQLINPQFGQFPEVKEGETLRTAEGRAEVLLSPGVFLRLAENSAVKMISNRLIDTRLEFLSGSALIEAAEIEKDTNLTVVYKETTLEFPKKGLFRLDSDPGSLKVYNGEAVVSGAGQTLTLKEGRMTLLAGVYSAEKFDNKVGDAFYRWAARRSGAMAAANVSAAKSVRTSGFFSGGSGMGTGMWQYNPYFGLFTFIPGMGTYYSPFGYYYYSPVTVTRVFDYARGGGYGNTGAYNTPSSGFNSTPRYSSDLGYNVGSRSSDSFISVPAASSNAAAAVSSSPRAGGDAGGGVARGGGGSGGRR